MATLPADPILVVSALAEEIEPLAGRLEGGRPARVGALRAWAGSISGRAVVVAAAGEGAYLAAEGVAALLEACAPRALLGIGVAGGLTDDLGAGDLIWSREVRTEAGHAWRPPAWKWTERAATGLRARGGSVVGMAQIVAESAAKRDLAQRLAIDSLAVVDLESPAWAAAAAERGLPWLVVRSVSDPVDQSLPLDFARFTTADGRVSRSRVFAHSIGRPRLWSSLKGLQRRLAECAAGLADATESLLAW